MPIIEATPRKAKRVEQLPGVRFFLDKRRRVSPEFYSAYMAGENMFPNTITGVGIFLGVAAITAIQEGVTTVEKFASSGAFNRAQMNETIDVIIQRHRQRGVLSIPNKPGLEMQPGERTFDADDRIPAGYKSGVMNVMNAVLGLRGIEEGRAYTQQDVTSEVSRFLREDGNLDRTAALFQAAYDAVSHGRANNIMSAHRKRLDFHKQDRPSQPATTVQRAEMLRDLDTLITEPVVAAGKAQGFTQQQIDDFIINLTNPELVEAA